MKGILFASFGTTHQPAREKHIDAVAAFIQAAMPEYIVAQAYTSSMVRGILAKRNIAVDDVAGALEKMARQGVTDVLVQPGHLMPGEEYEKLCRQAEGCRGLFASLRLGTPLMASTGDIAALADVLSAEYPPAPQTAVVFMGHGTHQFANTVYAALDYRLKDIGRQDMFVGTVEAYPGLEEVMRLLQGKGFANVLLAPLMQVAGDHALNDMAGEEPDSWASRLQAAGYAVECRLQGLGEMPAVQALYLDHIQKALVGE